MKNKKLNQNDRKLFDFIKSNPNGRVTFDELKKFINENRLDANSITKLIKLKLISEIKPLTCSIEELFISNGNGISTINPYANVTKTIFKANV
jgi:hypothetical protein